MLTPYYLRQTGAFSDLHPSCIMEQFTK